MGRKTAACVLLFSFGRPEIPVDTHVYRVGGRLGLIRDRASFDEAHDEILRVVDPEDAYELHINLIRHGRAVCRPRPRCDECALRRMCPYWRRLAERRRRADAKTRTPQATSQGLHWTRRGGVLAQTPAGGGWSALPKARKRRPS